MAALSEWLQIMLAEIARKREDLEKSREEESRRVGETQSAAMKAGAVQTGAVQTGAVQPNREARAG